MVSSGLQFEVANGNICVNAVVKSFRFSPEWRSVHLFHCHLLVHTQTKSKLFADAVYTNDRSSDENVSLLLVHNAADISKLLFFHWDVPSDLDLGEAVGVQYIYSL